MELMNLGDGQYIVIHLCAGGSLSAYRSKKRSREGSDIRIGYAGSKKGEIQILPRWFAGHLCNRMFWGTHALLTLRDSWWSTRAVDFRSPLIVYLENAWLRDLKYGCGGSLVGILEENSVYNPIRICCEERQDNLKEFIRELVSSIPTNFGDPSWKVNIELDKQDADRAASFIAHQWFE